MGGNYHPSCGLVPVSGVPGGLPACTVCST